MNKPLAQFGVAALLIAVTTLGLWLLRSYLNPANYSLVYLLVVLLIAIRQGTMPSLFAAILSLACFNFFLTNPFYTFFVHDPRELVDLLIFLVVALLTGQLAARARAEAEKAQQSAQEQMILFKLTSAFNQLSTTEGVYRALTERLREDLHATSADILPAADDSSTDQATVFYLLLRAGDGVYGTLCVSFDHMLTPVQYRLLKTCTDQAAMALHRIDLIERAGKSQTFEEADRLKTALLHAVSHDLRTPITIIKSSAHNLRTLSLPPDEQTETLEAVENEADELDHLVGNLLDFSRLRAGALRLNIRLNDLEEVAGDAAARAYQRLGQQRIKIAFPNDMPLVPFDYGLILQALNNLAENSVRYEPADRLVEISGGVSGGEARVSIANHGPNISPKEREQIMEAFHTGQDGHIGLGLPIAKGIVEAHHGTLWVDDTPGGGATFIFSLPLGGTTSENSGR